MNIIKEKKDEIMAEWRTRVLRLIPQASTQSTLALNNSLPDFLDNLARLLEAESEEEKMAAEMKEDLIGKVHGQHRANNSYSIEQMLQEYFILKDVLVDYLNDNAALTPALREAIGESFQRALQYSISQFSKSLLDAQENFVLAMAHDLRSPLMAIKMQAELLVRKKTYKEDSCIKITQYVDKVDKMIEALLDNVKSKNHGQNYSDYTEFDLFSMVMEVGEVYEELYPGVLIVKGTRTIVKWNRTSIERVIDNLVSNAFKYGDTSRPITISIRSDDMNVFFSIHNYGSPIPAEEQSFLFEKFKRTENSKKQKGWGIGLSYVKSQVEAHKGIILVNSDERGTSFKFEMPKNIGKSQNNFLSNARNSAA